MSPLEERCRCTSLPGSRSGIRWFEYAIECSRHLAEGVHKDAISRARRANPELVITSDQPAYHPALALVDALESADTVVVMGTCCPLRLNANKREHEPESPTTRTRRTPWSPH